MADQAQVEQAMRNALSRGDKALAREIGQRWKAQQPAPPAAFSYPGLPSIQFRGKELRPTQLPQPADDLTEAMARGMVRGVGDAPSSMTFGLLPGFGPQLEGGIDTLTSMLASSPEPGRSEALQEEFPVTSYISELVGSFAVPTAGAAGLAARAAKKPVERIAPKLLDRARQIYKTGAKGADKVLADSLWARGKGLEVLEDIRGMPISRAQGRLRGLISGSRQSAKNFGRYPPELQNRIKDLAFATESDFAQLAKDIAEELLPGLIPGFRTATKAYGRVRAKQQFGKEMDEIIKLLKESTGP